MRISRWTSGFRLRQKTLVLPTTHCRLMSSAVAIQHPRAAVAATIQWTCPLDKHQYLLVQRKNPPDQGKWCPPGGKILLGETTLDAAKRELEEETKLTEVKWHPNSFLTTDAIIPNGNKGYKFHYVIAHCFATAGTGSASAPLVVPSDDALDANWFSLEELQTLDCSDFTLEVLERAEAMSKAGLLPV